MVILLIVLGLLGATALGLEAYAFWRSDGLIMRLSKENEYLQYKVDALKKEGFSIPQFPPPVELKKK